MLNPWTASTDLRAPLSRRQALKAAGGGFGYLALAGMLGQAAPAAGKRRSAAGPLAAKPPHFGVRAKRIIFLFMSGGPSHVDTFDPKPQLAKEAGKPLPFAQPKLVRTRTGNLLPSPFKFRTHGQAGIPVSELFPEVARHVDDLSPNRVTLAQSIEYSSRVVAHVFYLVLRRAVSASFQKITHNRVLRLGDVLSSP